MTDLVAHVGETQNWVAEIIERRIVDPTQLPMEMAAVPTEPDDWPAWLSAGGARAAEAFSDEALEAPVFNAAADARTGGEFWLSSLLNEAVVHGADAASAAGRDIDVDADVAADLITNHLAMLTSPTWAAQRPESADALRGAGETLHWHATDEPGLASWECRRTRRRRREVAGAIRRGGCLCRGAGGVAAAHPDSPSSAVRRGRPGQRRRRRRSRPALGRELRPRGRLAVVPREVVDGDAAESGVVRRVRCGCGDGCRCGASLAGRRRGRGR